MARLGRASYLEQHERMRYRAHPETRVFFAALEKHVKPSIRGRIVEWPSVWPEVEYWFGGMDTFTRTAREATIAATGSTEREDR